MFLEAVWLSHQALSECGMLWQNGLTLCAEQRLLTHTLLVFSEANDFFSC